MAILTNGRFWMDGVEAIRTSLRLSPLYLLVFHFSAIRLEKQRTGQCDDEKQEPEEPPRAERAAFATANRGGNEPKEARDDQRNTEIGGDAVSSGKQPNCGGADKDPQKSLENTAS